MVIVTFNSASVIEALLDSVPAAMGGLSYVVTVVDNGSTDQTLDVIERRHATPAVSIVRSTNEGYSAGINRGVAASTDSAAVLVLNPDVVLDEGSVPTMVDELRPRVGIVVPQLRGVDGRRQSSLRRMPSLLRASGLSFTRLAVFSERVTDASVYAHRHEVEWATGAVLLVARECHVELGGWDETYFLYSEETDFFLRARDHGWAAVYVPDAGAVHAEGQSGRNDVTHTMQIVNRVRWYVRRWGTAKGWAYFLLTLLSEASWVVRGRAQSRAAIRALLRPSRRPAELGCGSGILPR